MASVWCETSKGVEAAATYSLVDQGETLCTEWEARPESGAREVNDVEIKRDCCPRKEDHPWPRRIAFSSLLTGDTVLRLRWRKTTRCNRQAGYTRKAPLLPCQSSSSSTRSDSALEIQFSRSLLEPITQSVSGGYTHPSILEGMATSAAGLTHLCSSTITWKPS